MSAPSPSMIWTQFQNELQRALPDFLKAHRWFGGKARNIRSVEIADAIALPHPAASAAILFIQVNYSEGPAETYTVPLLEEVNTQSKESPSDNTRILIRGADGAEHIFFDALASQEILQILFDAIRESRRLQGHAGELVGVPTGALEPLRTAAQGKLQPSLMKAEQSNTSALYGKAFVLKLFRHLEAGISPDFEIGRFLSEKAGFPNIPPMAGALEYRKSHGEPAAIALLQGFVANQGDAWEHTLKALSAYYDRVASIAATSSPERSGTELLGNYAAEAALLGQRTAELHAALASDRGDPDFAPEPTSPGYQRAVSDSMAPAVDEILEMLRQRFNDLPEHARPVADRVLSAKAALKDRFRSFADRKLTAPRTRIHGDFHLGQVLFTGGDFIFIDFEGEPARSLAERREKHSPLRDVAGMVRSFHYAVYGALFKRTEAGDAKAAALVTFANAWYRAVCDEYLRAYYAYASRADCLPVDPDERQFLLNFWLLGKAVYELKYELNHRLDWVAIPLEGIDALVGRSSVS